MADDDAKPKRKAPARKATAPAPHYPRGVALGLGLITEAEHAELTRKGESLNPPTE